MTDIGRQSLIPMSLTSIDASQCYNRVLHMILWMVWYSLVKLENVVVTIVTCLQLMEYFMRSGFGDSNSSYGGRFSSFRWDGLGQGSRGAYRGWIHVCPPMINLLRKCGLCSTLENSITRERTESVGSVYVDDVNMYSGGSIGNTAQEVVDAVSKQGHAWASLLKISGGCAKARKVSGI